MFPISDFNKILNYLNHGNVCRYHDKHPAIDYDFVWGVFICSDCIFNNGHCPAYYLPSVPLRKVLEFLD